MFGIAVLYVTDRFESVPLVGATQYFKDASISAPTNPNIPCKDCKLNPSFEDAPVPGKRIK
jgi:hypothetical protein